jgi:1-acyl-sn-glycerol-3-phosphate acyltransferase
VWRLFLRAHGGVSVHGLPPRGPCVVVANHRSHVDALALLAALPVRRVPRVAAAADHWFARPARRLVCRWLAAGFPVRRDSGGYADLLEAAEVLCSGGTVIVFPEGTRGTGAQPAPFHGGAFALARACGVPVVPAALTGTAQVLAKHARRPHRGAIRVEFSEPLWFPTPAQARRRVTGMLRAQPQRASSAAQ